MVRGGGECGERGVLELPQCQPIPDVIVLAVKGVTSRINYPCVTEKMERQPLLD